MAHDLDLSSPTVTRVHLDAQVVLGQKRTVIVLAVERDAGRFPLFAAGHQTGSAREGSSEQTYSGDGGLPKLHPPR